MPGRLANQCSTLREPQARGRKDVVQLIETVLWLPLERERAHMLTLFAPAALTSLERLIAEWTYKVQSVGREPGEDPCRSAVPSRSRRTPDPIGRTR